MWRMSGSDMLDEFQGGERWDTLGGKCAAQCWHDESSQVNDELRCGKEWVPVGEGERNTKWYKQSVNDELVVWYQVV